MLCVKKIDFSSYTRPIHYRTSNISLIHIQQIKNLCWLKLNQNHNGLVPSIIIIIITFLHCLTHPTRIFSDFLRLMSFVKRKTYFNGNKFHKKHIYLCSFFFSKQNITYLSHTFAYNKKRNNTIQQPPVVKNIRVFLPLEYKNKKIKSINTHK